MGDAHHCSGRPVSEMTYTVSSGTLNSSIPYHTIPYDTTYLFHAHVMLKLEICDQLHYLVTSLSRNIYKVVWIHKSGEVDSFSARCSAFIALSACQIRLKFLEQLLKLYQKNIWLSLLVDTVCICMQTMVPCR